MENGHHRDKHLRRHVSIESKKLLEVHQLVSGERDVEEFADLFRTLLPLDIVQVAVVMLVVEPFTGFSAVVRRCVA